MNPLQMLAQKLSGSASGQVQPGGAVSTPQMNWSGGWDPSAMLQAANQVSGKNLNDPGYWQQRYQEEGGASGAYGNPDYWYQKMMGRGASGADAALKGPYSAQAGYIYTPSAQELGQSSLGNMAQNIALKGLNFNPILGQQAGLSGAGNILSRLFGGQ